MTFLAKLGSFLAKGIALLTGLGPLILPLFGSKAQAASGIAGTIVNDLTAIGQVVVSAEAILGPGTGPAKLAAAAPLVANIIKTSELVSGHKIANEALFIQGCTDATNAVAEILNSLDAGAVQSQGQPVPAIPAPTVAPVPAALVGTTIQSPSPVAK
jgi:hypothetical protein